MKHQPLKYLAGIAAMAAALSVAGGGELSASAAPAWLAEASAPVVRVRVVLEATYAMGGQTEKQEFTSEVFGTVVDASGLVMLSNSHVSVSRAKEMMAAYGGGMNDPGWNVVPISFTAIGADRTERPAALVATDSDLDLAFLRLEQPPEVPLPAVSFATDDEVAVGDEVRLVGRLGAGFAFAPWAAWGRIAGSVETPRKAWIIDASDGMLGLPVYDARGRAIGVLTTLFARGVDPQESGFGLAQMMSRLGAGGNENGPVGVFALPGSAVQRLIGRALAQADSLTPAVATPEVSTPAEAAAPLEVGPPEESGEPEDVEPVPERE